MEEGRREEEDGHLLGHHLFDLRLHVTVDCFSFKTNKHREAELATARSDRHGCLCARMDAYREAECSIWRKPHPWVCQGRGTEGD